MDEPESTDQLRRLYGRLQSWKADIDDELADHLHCLEESERAAGNDERDAVANARRRFGSRMCVVLQLWFNLLWSEAMNKRDVLTLAVVMSIGYVFVGWMAWSAAADNRRVNELLMQQIAQLSATQANSAPALAASVGPDPETVANVASLIESAHAELKNRLSDLKNKTMEFRARNPNIIFNKNGVDPYADGFLRVLQKMTDLDSEREQLLALIAQVTEAREQGRSEAVIYQMLARNSRGLLPMSEIVQDPVSAHLDALEEEVESLVRERESLAETAEGLKTQSRKLQADLMELRLYESDREAINSLMTAYQEKLQELDLVGGS